MPVVLFNVAARMLQLTVQQPLDDSLPHSHCALTRGGLTQSLHKAAIVEAATRDVTLKAFGGVPYLCLLFIFEDAVAIHLRAKRALRLGSCIRVLKTRRGKEYQTAVQLQHMHLCLHLKSIHRPLPGDILDSLQ